MQTREKDQMELDEDQKRNPYETLLIQGLKEDGLEPGCMQMGRWSLQSDVKYVVVLSTPYWSLWIRS